MQQEIKSASNNPVFVGLEKAAMKTWLLEA